MMARDRRGYGGGRERFGGARGNEPRHRVGARDEGPPPPRRSSGWGVAPPSRHLWVGGLAPGVTASDLSELFLRCGDVEDIARDPGRSFAFVSFLREGDAIAAVRELQGARLGGAPVRIEFSKGDKASGSSMDDRYMQYADERHSIVRGRKQQPSPEKSIDKSKRSKSTEPSEVLWIGFPPGFKVDEAALWDAFLPFGEILRIRTFPGRTYAFVKYSSISAACRAKEALQGKLFNNPRVSICFSRNEGAAEVGKQTCVPLYSSQSSARHIYEQDFEAFPRARPFDSPPREFRMSSPQYEPNRLLREADDVSFRRNNYFHQEPRIDIGHVSNIEPFRMREPHTDRRMPEEFYEQRRQSSSVRSDAPWHNIPIEQPRRPFPLEDHWDVEDDLYPVTKKLRGGQYAELPEHPFSEFRPGKFYPEYGRRSLSDLPEDDLQTRTYQTTQIHDRHQSGLTDKHDSWHVRDSSARHLGELDRLTPEHHEPALKEEWSWNGTIAKGGTPICRARCFPVGNILNFMLPEFLNCTARTNLDMLAKHYYQAAASWVVFFVPENDADMAAYNEFMNYLGDKQRAAVCKLGERSTLFLVPPSEFSEQVLRVPGKVSISGVILKFLQSNPYYDSPNRKSLERGPPHSASHLEAGVSSHEDLDLLRRLNPPDIRAFQQVSDYISSSAGSYNPTNADFVPPYRPESAPLYADSQFLQHERPPPNSHMGGVAHNKHQQLPNVLPSSRSSNISEQGPDSGNFSSLAQDANAMSHAYNRTLEPKVAASVYAPAEASNSITWPPVQPKSQQVARPNQTHLPVSLPQDQLVQLTALLSQQNQPGKEVPIDSLNKLMGFQNSNPHGHAITMTGSSTGSGPIPIQKSLPPVPPSIPPLQVSAPSRQGSLPSNPSIPLPASAPVHALVYPPHSSMPLGSFVPPLPDGPPPYQQHTSSAPIVQPSVPSGQQPNQQCPPPYQQHTSSAPIVQPSVPSGQQPNQQVTSQEELDGDPQRRLQATLQLAAALLKQIQQQSDPSTKK